MARLGNGQEAREVAQEAYVRLLQLHQPIPCLPATGLILAQPTSA
jgi:hypothetical protein